MSERKRTLPGSPKKYVIEVGPIVCYDFTKGGIAKMERDQRQMLDSAIRTVMQVGPHSKVVTTRVVDA